MIFGLSILVLADDIARKLDDYPAKLVAGPVTFGIENLGPGVPSPSGSIYLDQHIAIEVSAYSNGKAKRVALNSGHFTLRINGAKTLIPADTPGAVAASVKYPDWVSRGRLEGTAGVGDAGVIFGRPRSVERFPGDPRTQQQDGGVNRVPRVESPVGQQAPEMSTDEIIQRAALPEGDVALPASGCLFFPFHGKMKKIKKLELVYDGPLGRGSVLIP